MSTSSVDDVAMQQGVVVLLEAAATVLAGDATAASLSSENLSPVAAATVLATATVLVGDVSAASLS